jgi:hypothetical protein
MGAARSTAAAAAVATLLSLTTSLALPCPEPPTRPRAALLAYTWGSGPSSCSPYFMRSWAALPEEQRTNTDLVILWEGSVAPCAGEPVGAGARYVKMPEAVLGRLKATRLNAAAYRMRAVTWWLGLSEVKSKAYGYVGVLDTDIIFQADLFDRLHAFKRSKHELHLVSESAIERNDAYTSRRLRGDRKCERAIRAYLANATVLPPDAVDNDTYVAVTAASQRYHGHGRALRSHHRPATTAAAEVPAVVGHYWDAFGSTYRLNFGCMFGTTEAMVALCEQVVDVLSASVPGMQSCWDQGLLNVIVWSGLGAVGASAFPLRIVVWDCFHGPVKTLDVGGLRDAHGRFYNEAGALYPIVHQFRPTRHSGFVRTLGQIFPPRGASTANVQDADASYGAVAWRAKIFTEPMQRTPFVWDDKRRMERLGAQLSASGLPNPADAQRPVPKRLPPCATQATGQYRPAASRDEDGTVHGAAWETMAARGFVFGAPRTHQA